MVDWLGVKDIVSFFADSNAILGALALVSGSFAGVIPRVGLVRALSLGYRSYFKTTYPLSVRESEIKQLNDLILRLEKKLNLELRKVLSLIKHFRSPIVVIGVPERLSGQPYADVPSAVRDLADNYGLRVVVDGCPNSLPPELLATKREMVIAVEPMSKEQIESIHEFKGLIDFLKSRNLDEPVWKVLGGSPVDYLKLRTIIGNKLSLSDTASDEVANQVKNHLQSVLSDSFSKN
eukprot:gene38630-50732_t